MIANAGNSVVTNMMEFDHCSSTGQKGEKFAMSQSGMESASDEKHNSGDSDHFRPSSYVSS